MPKKPVDLQPNGLARDLSTMNQFFRRGVDPTAPLRQFVYSDQARPAKLPAKALIMYLQEHLTEPEYSRMKYSALSKTALECMNNEFIAVIMNEAVEARTSRVSNMTEAELKALPPRHNVNELKGEDILAALANLGFRDYVEPCAKAHEEHKQKIRDRQERVKRKREEESKLQAAGQVQHKVPRLNSEIPSADGVKANFVVNNQSKETTVTDTDAVLEAMTNTNSK